MANQHGHLGRDDDRDDPRLRRHEPRAAQAPERPGLHDVPPAPPPPPDVFPGVVVGPIRDESASTGTDYVDPLDPISASAVDASTPARANEADKGRFIGTPRPKRARKRR
jgi:hypothetical protein